MVYLAKKSPTGPVVAHADQQAMQDMDGLSPEKIISDQEWQEAEGLARVINDKIFLGKTDAEKAVEQARNRVDQIYGEIDALEQKSIRSARGMAIALACGSPFDPDDIKYANEHEEKIAGLRQERDGLLLLLS
jgi:hypothetical protein